VIAAFIERAIFEDPSIYLAVSGLRDSESVACWTENLTSFYEF